jgi:hypothetical protein
MDKYVISDQLIRKIDSRKVLAGVFSTYTFEPDFFELDVIPILLPGGTAYSADDRVKSFQVREVLRDAGLELEVFYDLPMFRTSAETSPSMEYLCHGVKYNNGVFHAKNIYLLVEHTETQELSLLLASGSNNLTRAGWWENIEVQHWLEVKNGRYPPAFIRQLLNEIEFLRQNRGQAVQSSALEKIHAYLSACDGSEQDEDIYYFGIASGNNFFDFVENAGKTILTGRKQWTLEIISPFFAENTQNNLHRFFLDRLDVKNIVMLLPTDQEGSALCEHDYYQYIHKSEHIEWGEWHPKLAARLGLSGDSFRNVHAKVYHFYNTNEARVFIGSVNFSHKAIHDNIESGFLIKLDYVEPLLEPLTGNDHIERFKDKLENEPLTQDEESDAELPELHLQYDWITKTIKGRTAPNKRFFINLINSEGKIIINSWLLSENETSKCDVKGLEDLLLQGSLVLVSGQNADTEQLFPEHKTLLLQTGWSHKPLDLPDLTTEQILAIYAGMNPERRMMMLLNAKIQALVKKNSGGEITVEQDDTLNEQFFCEFAEIFHAFRTLKERLNTALEKGEVRQLDYYLTGKGVDSLPSLIKQKDNVSGVTYYLLLLLAKELYEDQRFQNRPGISEQLNNVETNLRAVKASDAIVLERSSEKDRQRFFNWYETQFFMQYATSLHGDGEA